MVGYTSVASAGVGLGDTQARHRSPAQGDDGIDRVPAGHPGEAPGRLCAQVPGALNDDGGIRVQHVPGGQECVVDADRLNITTPGLPGRHGPGQPPGLTQGGGEA